MAELGGALIRTGRENGRVWMLAHVLEEPPQEVATGWEEVVEVSWHAATGGASVTGAQEVEPQLRRFTPPWPGDYRLRVHAQRSVDPWVAVLDVGGAVIAVEYNGFCGSRTPVLERASATGRAASMYWNVNALTRLSFAEHGEVLSDEPFGDLDAPPQLAALLSDLDFSDLDRRRQAQGLLAVQRFTGHGITAEDLARIEAADIAFRIVPDLPTLYPRWRSIDNALGSDAEALTGLPEPALRDLAWWAASEAARYVDLDEDPDIVASINARALTPEAHLRARRSQLGDHEHQWLWFALHHATNPDPPSAAAGAINAARYAAGPHAANLITDAKARIATLTTP